MPLVVPGMMSNDSSKDTQLVNQLMGKKIGDSSNETTFARKDLPKEHRIIRPGDSITADHKQYRWDIHLADDGTVAKVSRG